MPFKSLVILGLIGMIMLIGVSYWKMKPQEKIKEQSTKDFSTILNFDGIDTQNVNVSSQESEQVKSVVDVFEKKKYQKDFVSAIGLLSPPANQEESGWLEHFLGNDLASLNDGKPSPRFLNKDKFHLLVGYDIDKIEERGGVIYVSVKELRVLDMSEEGSTVRDFETNSQDLIFEIVSTDYDLQISRYYHAKITSQVMNKYEGFMAY